MRIGVLTTTSTLPPSSNNPYNTANGFKVGLADNGPVGAAVKCLSPNDVANMIGPRSTTNQVLYDAAENHFREFGSALYLSRVVGATPVNASLTLQDVTPHPTVVVTAKYPGVGPNSIKVATAVSGGNYTVTLTDASGNVLETHGPYATASGNAPLLADTTSSLVNFTQSAGSGFTTVAPNTLAATSLTGGTDDRGTATIANWQTALAAFGANLGPGQVSADGMTNTALAGIWSALGTHAQANNRVALLDTRDGQTAAQIVTDVGSFGSSSVASYCAFWAGQVQVPGIAPGTSRMVPASSSMSALCAQADQGGNPNVAAAGDSFPLQFATGFSGVNGAPLYTQPDIDTLNAAGVNTWNNWNGENENYGFVSAVPATTDAVYWQFNHARLRMAIVAGFQIIAHPFLFSQIDGKGLDIAAFGGDLAAYLQTLVDAGALYVTAPNGATDQGFVVDTSPNTPATIASGQLLANVQVRMSMFAQMIAIQLASVPITQSL